jgi:phenylpropionate dioxygenase-like ring-hydroxylating dioxygenase large terminal subunit
MKLQDYTEGDTFQAEKRTVFSTEWLPLCAEGQLGRPGDFVAATVGGWSVVGIRDKQGDIRVLRNACRHQNMQVVGTPTGTCESLRCRFHGWTYDLQGRFVAAPPPVAPKEVTPDLNLAVLPTTAAAGLVFFSLAEPGTLAAPSEAPPSYGGTRATDIACNWKVCVEHLLAEHAPSPDFAWLWPLLAIRRAGTVTIVEQVVPHTFLRTRLFTHVFGAAADEHKPATATIKHVCETLQAERAAGVAAVDSPFVATFHARLAASVGAT